MALQKIKPLKIAVFAADRWEHVCPTLRIVGPATQAGMLVIKGNDWPNDQLQVHLDPISEADLVVIQRDFPRYIEAYENVTDFAHQRNIPIIYELDDLLPELSATHPDKDHYLETRPAILRAVVEADAITASTPCLVDYLKPFNPEIFLLRNYLMDQLWHIKPPKEISMDPLPLLIGYMGGSGHAPDMELVYPVLRRILARYGSRVGLKFWGLHPPEDILSLPMVSWTHPYLLDYSAFASYFFQQECDIWIAPIQDNVFNRCKSGLKYLEYSTTGIPGVYSDLPPYNEIVRSGQNGFLASTAAEWEENLVSLIENADLRHKMAAEAQRTISNDWLLSNNAYRWRDTYNQVLQTHHQVKVIPISQRNAALKKAGAWYVDLVRDYLSLEKQNQEIKAEQERVIKSLKAEQERVTESLKQKIIRAEQEAQARTIQLAEFQNGPTWKAFLKFRQVFAPKNSLSEKLILKTITALSVWRHQGFRAMVALAIHFLRRPHQPLPAGQSPAQPPNRINPIAVDGTTCSQPAVSLIYVINSSISIPEINLVENWLSRQTWTGWELVIWDQAKEMAWEANLPAKAWQTGDPADFYRNLSGKYVCVATPDLLDQPETFLETNLIALESENLVFTLNINYQADWIFNYLENGRLPGSDSAPLQRMLVNKEYLSGNFQIDLSSRINNKNPQPIVAGKIIFLTTNEVEMEGGLLFNLQLKDISLELHGNLLLARPAGTLSSGQVTHVIHPVDTVLPIIEHPSDKPTVVLFMPFLAVGGAEKVHLDIIRTLKDQIRFVILTLDPHDPAIGTTVNNFRSLTPYVYNGHDFLDHNLNFSLVSYLIKSYKPQTLYIANGSPWIYDALPSIKQVYPDIRLVNQVYDHQAGWINRYDQVLARILDSNIAINHKIQDAYLEKGVRKQAAVFIENGVNKDEFDPGLYPPERIQSLKQKLKLDPTRKVVTFMARLHPQKRPMDFVEVARRCANDLHVQFLMVGDGMLAKTVDEEISRIGLTNITRLSFYSPSSDIFAVTDIYVLPSEYEGMPMVLLEAQSMGKPVVVTDVGNNREVLEITHGGTIVNRIGDASSLRTAILKTLESPPDSQKIRKAIMENYSLDVYKKYLAPLLGD